MPIWTRKKKNKHKPSLDGGELTQEPITPAHSRQPSGPHEPPHVQPQDSRPKGSMTAAPSQSPEETSPIHHSTTSPLRRSKRGSSQVCIYGDIVKEVLTLLWFIPLFQAYIAIFLTYIVPFLSNLNDNIFLFYIAIFIIKMAIYFAQNIAILI